MIKDQLKKFIGQGNIYYLRSFFPSEAEKAALIRRKIFFSSFIKEGDIYFDIGANIGNRIEPIKQLGAKIIALEPQDMCYNYLKKKYGQKIIAIKKGVGASNEKKTFHISSSHTISSFSEDWIDTMKKTRFKDENWDKEQVVEMITLDALIDAYGIPAFIKIDVEGYEPEVLKGLTNKNIKMISFEYSVPEQTKNSIDCISRLKQINPNYVFNYSVGESLKFDMKNWISAQELILHFSDPTYFTNKDAGDIYAKLPN